MRNVHIYMTVDESKITEVIEEVRRLYWDEGKSTAQIGELLGLSKQGALYLMKKHNIPRRSRSESQQTRYTTDGRLHMENVDPEEVRRLYWEEKKSTGQIGKLLGLPHQNVYSFMVKNNIPTRTPSESVLVKYKVGVLDPEEVRRLYWDEKKSRFQISKLFGVSESALHTFMQRHNIPGRNYVEARKVKSVTETINSEEVRRLYWDEKKSAIQIGKLFSIPTPAIYYYMKRYNIPRRGGTEAQLVRYAEASAAINPEELKRLYWDEGKSTIQIGKLYGLTPENIRSLMKQYNIPIRTNSEALCVRYKTSESPPTKVEGESVMEKSVIDPEELKRLYWDEKKTTAQISELFRLPKHTALYLMRKHNIPRRARVEAVRLRFATEVGGTISDISKKVTSNTQETLSAPQKTLSAPTTTRGKIIEKLEIKREERENVELNSIISYISRLIKQHDEMNDSAGKIDDNIRSVESQIRETSSISFFHKNSLKKKLEAYEAEKLEYEQQVIALNQQIDQAEWLRDNVIPKLVGIRELGNELQDLGNEFAKMQSIIINYAGTLSREAKLMMESINKYFGIVEKRE